MTDHDSNKVRILNKIKRCLALSKSSNEHEAATALRQAHKLMSAYNIDERDIKLADIAFNKANTKVAKNPANHIWRLVDMIARLYGCKYYRDIDDELTKYVYTFVGLEIHSDVAGYAFDVLSRQLDTARKNYIKTALKRVKVRSNKITRADAFCAGWVQAVERLVKDLTPIQADMPLIEKAIADQVALSQAKDRNRLKGKAGKRINDDFYNGVIQGKKAQLIHALHGKEGQALIN